MGVSNQPGVVAGASRTFDSHDAPMATEADPDAAKKLSLFSYFESPLSFVVEIALRVGRSEDGSL